MYFLLLSSVTSRLLASSVKRFSSKIMEKPNILVTRCDFSPSVLAELKSKCNVTIWNEDSAAPREFVLENVKEKDGIFCFLTDKIDSELLSIAGPKLKAVSTFSVGYDHIDLKECKLRNIKVGYTPDVLTEATAELTLGLLLCTSRRLMEAHNEAVTGGWKTWSPLWLTGPGLADSTVGIVGFGRIGQSVALKVKAFNAKNILYFNRSEKSKEASVTGAKKVTLDELLGKSDFVICCCALTQETQNLFNAVTFSKMKNTAIFVNTSRGGLVNQDDLVNALENGTIRGAGLDVTMPEPLPPNHPLFKLKNCVILPHIGSATVEARTAMAQLATDNLLSALQEKPMPAELKI